MFQPRIALFLTLVLVAPLVPSSPARGARTTPSPDFEEKPGAAPRPDADREARSLTDIAQPPPAKNPHIEQEYFYPFRRAFTLRIGQVNSSQERNGTKSPRLAGVQFLYTTLDRIHYEGAADLLTDGSGTLQFGERFVYTHGTFRPYTGFGGRLLVKPADGLAVFVNFANFQVAGSVGLEYLAYKAQSLRLELAGALGTKSLDVISALGYVWAW